MTDAVRREFKIQTDQSNFVQDPNHDRDQAIRAWEAHASTLGIRPLHIRKIDINRETKKYYLGCAITVIGAFGTITSDPGTTLSGLSAVTAIGGIVIARRAHLRIVELVEEKKTASIAFVRWRSTYGSENQ